MENPPHSKLLMPHISSSTFLSSWLTITLLWVAHERVSYFILERFYENCTTVECPKYGLYGTHATWSKAKNSLSFSQESLNIMGLTEFILGPLISRKMRWWLASSPLSTHHRTNGRDSIIIYTWRNRSKFFSTLASPTLLFLQFWVILTNSTSTRWLSIWRCVNKSIRGSTLACGPQNSSAPIEMLRTPLELNYLSWLEPFRIKLPRKSLCPCRDHNIEK